MSDKDCDRSPLAALVEERLKSLAGIKKPIVFTISSTAKIEPHGYVVPVREYEDFVMLGCVLFSTFEIDEFVEIVDGNVALLLVDAEKKAPLKESHFPDYDKETIGAFTTGNFPKRCFELFKKTVTREYKPNDLTVDAAWQLISRSLGSLAGIRICIIGLGNIGSKLSLRFVECGASVNVYGRDFSKVHTITQALNLIKPSGTIATITAHASVENAAFRANVIIGATNGIPVISDNVVRLLSPSCLIVDLGKGTIARSGMLEAEKNRLTVFRTDVSNRLQHFVRCILEEVSLPAGELGMKRVEGYKFIAGGLLGADGDIVVDNLESPKRIYGIADGKGSIKEQVSIQVEERLIAVLKGSVS